VFENRVLRGIFGPRREEVVRGWRRLYNMELRNLYVKVKLPLCLTRHHAMKVWWGNGSISQHILDLGIRWR
jgi:hypothetical protein